jgi:hypothetical protein
MVAVEFPLQTIKVQLYILSCHKKRPYVYQNTKSLKSSAILDSIINKGRICWT